MKIFKIKRLNSLSYQIFDLWSCSLRKNWSLYKVKKYLKILFFFIYSDGSCSITPIYPDQYPMVSFFKMSQLCPKKVSKPTILGLFISNRRGSLNLFCIKIHCRIWLNLYIYYIASPYIVNVPKINSKLNNNIFVLLFHLVIIAKICEISKAIRINRSKNHLNKFF